MKNLVDHHNGCTSEARLLELNYARFIFPKNMAVSHENPDRSHSVEIERLRGSFMHFWRGRRKNRDMFRAEKIGLVGTNPIDFILIIFVVRAHWAPFRCDRAFQQTAFWALLKKNPNRFHSFKHCDHCTNSINLVFGRLVGKKIVLFQEQMLSPNIM